MAPAKWLLGRKNTEVKFGHLSERDSKDQKTLIPLHFGNPKLHNKLLAHQHPNMG